MCEAPARPHLPATLPAFLAACCAIRAQLALGDQWPRPMAPALCLLAVLLAVWALRRPAAGGACLLVAACVAASLVSGAAELASQAGAARLLASVPVSRVTFVTCGDARRGDFGWSSEARAVVDGRDVGEVLLATDAPVGLWSEVRGAGRFSAPADEARAASMRGRGLAGTVRLSAVRDTGPRDGPLGAVAGVRESLVRSLAPGSSGPRAVVCAMGAAWRRDLDAGPWGDVVARAGLSHLVAVSGAHLAAVSGMLGRAGRGRVALGPRVAVTAAATGAFVLFCGAPVSAVRAWAMAQSAAGSAVAGRRASPVAALGLVGLLLCLTQPAATGDLGFLLSFGCVAALCLFGPWARHVASRAVPWRGAAARVRGRGLRRAVAAVGRRLEADLCAGAVCSLAAAPLVCSAFGRVSLVGPVAGAVAAPLFAPLVALSVTAVLLAPVPVAGPAVLCLAEGAASALLAVARAASAVPWGSLPAEVAEPWATAVPVACACALLARWPCPRGRTVRRALGALAALALAAVLAPLLSSPSITVLDVGQGDAVLLKDGARAVLVDAGPPRGGLAAALRRHGVASLDAVVVTHQHDDHYGGLEDLAGTVFVGRLVVARGVAGRLADGLGRSVEALGCPVEEVEKGDRICAGSWVLEVLWPDAAVDGADNEDSLCLLARFGAPGDGGVSALLTGDAERSVVGPLAGAAGPVDVLKLGHHGSRESVDGAVLDDLDPVACVASAGTANPFGHPDPHCRELVEASGARFLCTAEEGDVEVLADASRGVALAR